MKSFTSELFKQNNDSSLITFSESFILFAVSFCLFTIGLFNHEFIQFEARFGLFSQEMLRNGLSLFPTTYNKFYPDYPATYTILTYFFAHLFGRFNILVAVIPTALTSALTIVLIYLTGCLRSKKWGIYAVFMALLTFNFLTEARTISLDQFTATATALAFYCCYSADVLQKPQRLYLLPIALFYGFIFRGPIGIVIPTSIVCSYFLLEKKFREFALFAPIALLIFIICVIGLLSAAWHTGGGDLVHQVIRMEALGRLDSYVSVPFYYYFTSSIYYYALSYPLAILIIIFYGKNVLFPKQNADFILLRHLSAWLLIILIGLSIPSDEKARYILPITPAIALIASYLFINSNNYKILNALRDYMIRALVYLPILALLSFTIVMAYSEIKAIDFGFHRFLAFFVFIGESFLGIYIYKTMLDSDKKNIALLSLGIITLVAACAFIIQPIDIHFNAAKPFVQQTESYRQSNKLLVFYQIGPDGEDIKYMVALDKPAQPVFIQQATDILKINTPAVFIAKQSNFDAMPANIKSGLVVLFNGRLGHQPCVVFMRK